MLFTITEMVYTDYEQNCDWKLLSATTILQIPRIFTVKVFFIITIIKIKYMNYLTLDYNFQHSFQLVR